MTTYARLIGVNNYETGTQLHGCVNDVQNMEVLLKSLNVSVLPSLCDADANVRNVLTKVRGDVGLLGVGDQLIVHFSGHGVQLYDGVTRAAACPVDFQENDPSSGISDLDIEDLLSRLDPNARVTIFVDCCFSGGLERDYVLQLAEKAPEQHSKFRVRRFPATSTEGGSRHLLGIAAGPRTFDDVIANNGDVVLLSASGFQQTSGEDDFEDRTEGVFTHFLVEHLKGGNVAEPASATLNAICAATKNSKYPQVAELHGRKASWSKPLIQR